MKQINFKDYTRVRDIVVKRNKRAVSAGLMPSIHFPTVKEIKAGLVDPGSAWRAVQMYYSGGSQVKTIRQTGIKPAYIDFPVYEEPKQLTQEEKKEKRKKQQRDYRRRVKIDSSELLDDKQKDYFKRYLKGLPKIVKKFNIPLDVDKMSPNEIISLGEYLDYRFSQGEFNQEYIIEEFVEQYDKLKSKGYTDKEIQTDFSKFLLDRQVLTDKEGKILGLNADEVLDIWDEFINELGD